MTKPVLMSIQLFVIEVQGIGSVIAKTADGELLAIGAIVLTDNSIYVGDHYHRNSDLRKLDEIHGWTGGYDYGHHLATARRFLEVAAKDGKRVSSGELTHCARQHA